MMETILILQNTDFAPSAKSITLTESFDKIINTTLEDNSIKIFNKSSKIVYKDTIKQEDNCTQSKSIKRYSNTTKDKQLVIHSDKMKVAKKYFKLWKIKAREKRRIVEKKEKITNFLEQLKKQKSIKTSSKSQTISNENDQNKNIQKKRHKDISEIYKNRYKAQQDLIKAQQNKLQEQAKVIEDLKLGVIMEETQKSLESSKYEIQEIFRKCSARVKCKITPPEAVEKDINIIELRSSKAPKILGEMDKRAEERAIRRNIILEKKRLIEEKKRKEVESLIANKKATDEEQKRKNLEAIKEQRRLETELDKKRQDNKRKYLESINKADRFCKKKLKRKFFDAFKKLMFLKIEFELKSELYYKNLLERKSLNNWKIYVKEKIEKQYFDADCLHDYKLMKKVFKSWHSILVLQKQSMQVAEDLYDMRLQSKVFIYWHRIICQQQMTEIKNTQIANRHYNSRILLHYFYQWKSLPAVIQLEKAKEQKKRKWREKVWEILPDYKPCVDFI